MTAAILFACYAMAVGLPAPAVLRREWAARSPRLAMSLWLALPASWVAAAMLAGLAVASPSSLIWPGPRSRAGRALLTGPGGPGGRAIAAAALVLAAAIALRAGSCLAGELARIRREQREHAAFVAVAGRLDPVLGAAILDLDAPAAYCLPYGRSRIVVSTGALAALSPAQLKAVLAHEHAHLRGRHDLVVAAGSALARAFPWIPLFAQAGPEIAGLAEMAADDMAARAHARGDLAAALVILARAGVRAAALSAGGPAAIARIRRLLAPLPQRPARGARLAVAAGLLFSVTIAGLPVVIAACDLVSRP